jgi:hypothetical protein
MTMSPFLLAAALLVLSCGGWLCLVVIKRNRFRPQFSLRSLLVLTAVVALALGSIESWPTHVATLNIPRLEVKSNRNYATGRAVVLDISRQHWGRTAIRVTPQDGFCEASKADLFWLESGNLRHVALASQGRPLVTALTVPSQWPLDVGVVQYQPETIYVSARRIFPDGHEEGGDGFYDAHDPYFQRGIENWGRHHLQTRWGR